MPSLSKTAAFLSQVRQMAEASLTAALTENALLVETESFGANPGQLRMLSHTPEGLAPGAPLVVTLHGCTQRAESFAVQAGWIQLSEQLGFGVLAPEQAPGNNPNRCFNWFETGDATRGHGEVASIRAMIAEAVRRRGFDKRRIYVTGLSAGGAMAAALLAAYPEVFAGAAIIAGVPYGVARNVREGLSAMRGEGLPDASGLAERVRRAASQRRRPARISIWHGEADRTVDPANAQALAVQWVEALGLPEDPREIELRPDWTRTLWRSPSKGEAAVELHLLRDLAHGAPLASLGPMGLGAAAPYMLETGVSSTLEIARFWGLMPADAEAAPTIEPARAPPRPAAAPEAEPKPQPARAARGLRRLFGRGA